MNLSRIRLRGHLPWLILLALPVLFHLPALTGILSPDPMTFVGAVGATGKHFFPGAPWIDPNVGFQGQALGKLSADTWLSGRIPWWNSYNGVGLPLAAEAQPASLFLPFILLMHFQAGGVWLEMLMQIIAGLCTYALLRQLKLTQLAAFVGAMVFELNGTFGWHGAPIATPIAFLPMLILGMEQLRARVAVDAPGGWLLIPIALAWSIYAGFPETAYIDGLFAGCWGLSRLAGMTTAHKIVFIRRLGISACIGLLMSAPLIVPFAEYVGRAYVGGHENLFTHARPAYSMLAQILAPSLYGPIGAFDDPTHEIMSNWGNIGGYFTALEFFVVLVGFVFCRRGLYLALLAWIFLCVAKTFDVRPISDLVNLIPMIKSAAFFRYSPPSWEFAGAILIALTIDGMQRRTRVSSAGLMTCFVLVGIAILASLKPARKLIKTLLLNPTYSPYHHIAIGWLALSVIAAMLFTTLHGRWRHVPYALVALLTLDTCMAFALPIGSGFRALPSNKGGVTFLQTHVGLQRVYSLGPLAPNYGGYFRIAQINHNYLPVSQDWVQYVHDYLDPDADPILFTGNFAQTAGNHGAMLLNTKQAVFEELGVRYVLAPTGINPFLATSAPTASRQDQPNVPMPLANGASTTIHWVLPALPEDVTVHQASVEIGNYVGQSDGRLRVKICSAPGTCAQGARSLTGSADNAAFMVELDHPLILPRAEKTSITATITDEQSSHPVALWLMNSNATQDVSLDGRPAAMAPSLILYYPPKEGTAKPESVYHGPDMDIYELPNPKPYFETRAPGCSLHSINRSEVIVRCEAPTQLLRREAFYPGWYAQVDGKTVQLQRDNEIFQSLSVPAGTHKIAFGYRPTHAFLVAAAFVAGLLAWLLGVWRALPSRRCGI